MLGNSAAPHACTFGGKRTMDSMFGGAQFVPRRSTEAGAPINDRDQEQSGEGRSQDQVPNLQKSVFVPKLSWTTTSNHALSHNIYTIEDITFAALLASQAEQSGEPFHVHMLPTPTAIKKGSLSDVHLMEHFVKSPSYSVDSAAHHRLENGLLPTAFHTTRCRPRRSGL